MYFINTRTRGKKYGSAVGGARARKVLKRKYDQMSDNQRAQIVAEWQETQQEKLRAIAAAAARRTENVGGDFQSLWGAGNAETPIAPERLQRFANQLFDVNVVPGAPDRGLVIAGREVRKPFRKKS